MNQELEQLLERTDRLLDIVRRLSQENSQLRAQLTEAQGIQAVLRERMTQACERVETALSRLPIAAGQEH